MGMLGIIILVLLAIVAAVLLFVFAKPEEDIKVGHFVIYTLPALILMISISLLGFFSFGMKAQQPRPIGLLVLLLFLILGSLHLWGLNVKKKYQLPSKLLFTAFLMLISVGLTFLILEIRGDSEVASHRYNYIGGILMFPVPFLVNQAAGAFLDRPVLPIPKTCFASNDMDIPQLNFRSTIPLTIKFAALPNSNMQVFKKVIKNETKNKHTRNTDP